MLQPQWRCRRELNAHFWQNQLAVGRWRSAERGDGILVQRFYRQSRRKGACKVLDEESGSVAPGSEPTPKTGLISYAVVRWRASTTCHSALAQPV